jgi:hypothetical protein
VLEAALQNPKLDLERGALGEQLHGALLVRAGGVARLLERGPLPRAEFHGPAADLGD